MSVEKTIKLKSYGDKEIKRKLIRETDDSVIVCTLEEYERAVSEGFEPLSVAYPKKYIISSNEDGDS